MKDARKDAQDPPRTAGEHLNRRELLAVAAASGGAVEFSALPAFRLRVIDSSTRPSPGTVEVYRVRALPVSCLATVD